MPREYYRIVIMVRVVRDVRIALCLHSDASLSLISDQVISTNESENDGASTASADYIEDVSVR